MNQRTGLDSFAAKQVMHLLQRVARANTTVVFTIHQPSSNIFASFDNLILLHQGELMYTGRTKQMPTDFAAKGHPMPDNYNPADWLLQVAELNDMNDLKKAGFFPQVNESTLHPTATADKLTKEDNDQHPSAMMEFQMLTHREFYSLKRNPTAIIINAVITFFMSLISGIIFNGAGDLERINLLILQGQLGAMTNLLISTMMGQAQTALGIFSNERSLFLREYATRHYSVTPYFLSHFMTEVLQAFVGVIVQTITVYWLIGLQQRFYEYMAVMFALSMATTAIAVWLGSIFSDPKLATSMFTPILVPQFYFSGIFISMELIPSWVRWAQWTCTLTYASRLMMIYEFGDCNTEICDEFLQQMQVKEDGLWWYWLALIGLFIFFRSMSIYTLRQKGLNFE